MMERRKSDFFLSRRGSVAEIAREVADVLTERGYTVIVQDYDIPLTANFVEAMHEAIKNSRDLVVLFTSDYETSPYTRKEFTSFEADRALSGVERRVVILRCENAPLRGLFAPNVYQDLVGIDDPQERKRRIIAAVEGRSQAQKPPPRPFVGVPPRVANFTGRATELDRLDAILLGGGKPAAITQISGNIGRAAVRGLGGVGKTSLAVEYAHRYRDLYAGVWWCPAENRLDLIAGLAAVAKHMDANAWGDSEKANLEDAAKRGLRSLAEQRATHLLVYDNVTSPSDIADLLPAAGARLLITSRFPDWTGWAEEVGLDMLSLGEATTYVQARAGRSDAAGASTIAEAVGQLPLALDHAAAYCKRTQISFVDYAARVTQLITTLPSGTVYPRSVAATFDLAIAGAIASCQAAEGLMAYLAHCGPERIPTALVEGVTDDEATRTAALLALGDVSLIKADPYKDGTAAWTVHRLVQGVARTRAKAVGFEAQALQLLIERLAEIYPADGFDNRESWPLCARLTPHVFASCASGIPDEGLRMAQLRSDLLRRAGKFCRGGSYYREFSAEWLLRTALAISENALGPEHPQTARCLNNLAFMLKNKVAAGAEGLLRRALAIYEKALDPKHDERLLADYYSGIKEMALDPVEFSTKENYLEHVESLQSLPTYAEAGPLYEEMKTGPKGIEPDDTLSARYQTLYVRLRMRQYMHQYRGCGGEMDIISRAANTLWRYHGSDHPWTRDAIACARSLEDWESISKYGSWEAMKWYQKAADKGDASAMVNLGVLFANGRGVEQDYAKAMKWYQKAADKGDASAMKNLGVLYDNGQGVPQDYAKAREWYEKAAAKGNEDAKTSLEQLPIR